jgi:hypothetical protein
MWPLNYSLITGGYLQIPHIDSIISVRKKSTPKKSLYKKEFFMSSYLQEPLSGNLFDIVAKIKATRKPLQAIPVKVPNQMTVTQVNPAQLDWVTNPSKMSFIPPGLSTITPVVPILTPTIQAPTPNPLLPIPVPTAFATPPIYVPTSTPAGVEMLPSPQITTPSVSLTAPGTPPAPSTEESKTSKLPLIIGVVVVAGAAAFFLMRKKSVSTPKAV